MAMTERTKAEALYPSSADWQDLRKAIVCRRPTGGLDRRSFVTMQRLRSAFVSGVGYIRLTKDNQELGRIYATEVFSVRWECQADGTMFRS